MGGGRLLSTTELSKLAACFQTAHYKEGDVILREGQVRLLPLINIDD